jgi:hypothetical protein
VNLIILTLRHLTATKKDSLLRLSGDANARSISDSKQEDAHEKRDRAWRRWASFLKRFRVLDPFADGVSADGRELLGKCFLVELRKSTFHKSGHAIKEREKPMVATTL